MTREESFASGFYNSRMTLHTLCYGQTISGGIYISPTIIRMITCGRHAILTRLNRTKSKEIVSTFCKIFGALAALNLRGFKIVLRRRLSALILILKIVFMLAFTGHEWEWAYLTGLKGEVS